MINSSQTFLARSFKPLLLAAALGLAGAGAGAVVAGDGPQHDPAARMAKMAERLSLDDSQKASVAAIYERNGPAQKALRERSHAHFKALKALDPKSADYSSRSQALADEAGTLARDRVLQRTQLKGELATILTPEQMSKMREHGGRGGKHHRGGHRKGGKPAAEAAS